jgi:linoleoyl-CoA desaturase
MPVPAQRLSVITEVRGGDGATLHARSDSGQDATIESALREFAKREWLNRVHPGAARVTTAAISRLVPLVAGWLALLFASPREAALGAVVFAVADVSMLASWFHDGVHRSSAASRPVARGLMRIAAAPAGFGPRWWDFKHVRLHHRYPGDPRFDPDIQFGALARLTRAQPRRALHRGQHIYMWLLLPFTTVNMLKPSELWCVARFRELLPGRRVPPAWRFLADRYPPCLGVWAPVIVIRGWQVGLALLLVFHLVAGTLVALVTQVQHNTTITQPEDPTQWRFRLWEQVRRSSDVTSRSGLWRWLAGGTNTHAAHHLMPGLSFLELPGVTLRLRALLASLGVDVPTHISVGAAVRSHARLIRDLAKGA